MSSPDIYTGVSATAEEEAKLLEPVREIRSSFGPRAKPGLHEQIYGIALGHGLPGIPGWYGYDFERHEFTHKPFERAQ